MQECYRNCSQQHLQLVAEILLDRGILDIPHMLCKLNQLLTELLVFDHYVFVA